ncbi:MAG: AMP-binding protein [Oscillospiraceae bacterium]|jgi:acetyl-CoA synthetase|nr:AMP-binding protein [Oscillospiraceae bacterium]
MLNAKPRNINLRYVEEEYGSDGVLSKFALKYPANFNFGYDVVDDIAVNDPERKAMVWCGRELEPRTFTFADMKTLSDRTCNYLRSLGIGKGDFVLVVLKRHWQFWPISVALCKLGAVMVPATYMLKSHDAEYRVKSSGATAVLCTVESGAADAFDAIAESCPELTVKISVNGRRDGWLDFDTEMPRASDSWQRVETNVHEPMLTYFSSGTSGYPKMVLHDHLYSLGHLLGAKHWHNVNPQGLHFTIADTGWGKAVWGKLYGQWLMEACVFTFDFDTFVPTEILSLIARFQITTLCCPPTMYRFLLKEDFTQFDLSKLEYCTTAGEALNPDVFNDWRTRTGIAIMEGFGQTETTVTMCNLKGTVPIPGSLGKPSPQYVVDLLDPDGNPCKTGETGELCMRYAPHHTEGLMMCYYLDDEKTGQAMRDGWYHTGDTAWRDEDGYYFYVGRNDDIIKSSGYRIGPFEIESVLVQHPAVLECAITGVPDTEGERGFLVKATVVLNTGFTPSDALVKELQTYVKNETAPYKYPRIVEFVSALPKTINGKIQRAEIRRNS